MNFRDAVSPRPSSATPPPAWPRRTSAGWRPDGAGARGVIPDAGRQRAPTPASTRTGPSATGHGRRDRRRRRGRQRTRSTSRARLTIPILAPQAWANWTRAADQVDVLQVLRAGRAADGGHHHRARVPHRLRPEAAGRGEPPGPGQLAGAHAVRRLPAPGRNRQPGRLGARRPGPGVRTRPLLQNSYANLYRTQEALGILLGEDEPVDVGGRSRHSADAHAGPGRARRRQGRTDMLLFRQQQKAADRSLNMSWTEYLPSSPRRSAVLPGALSSLTTPKTGWQVQAHPHLVPLRRRSPVRTYPRARGAARSRRASSSTHPPAGELRRAGLRGQHRADDGRGRASNGTCREAGGGRDAPGRDRLPRRVEHESRAHRRPAPGPGRGDASRSSPRTTSARRPRPPVRFRSLPCPADPGSPGQALTARASG